MVLHNSVAIKTGASTLFLEAEKMIADLALPYSTPSCKRFISFNMLILNWAEAENEVTVKTLSATETNSKFFIRKIVVYTYKTISIVICASIILYLPIAFILSINLVLQQLLNKFFSSDRKNRV